MWNAARNRPQIERQTAQFICGTFRYKSYEILTENDQEEEKQAQLESEKVKTDVQRNGNNTA